MPLCFASTRALWVSWIAYSFSVGSRANGGEALGEVFDDEVLDVFAAVAGEAEDAVGVVDPLEGAGEEDEALLLEVDDALGRLGGGLGARLGEELLVAARVGGVVGEVVAGAALLDALVGGGGQVEDEGAGDAGLDHVAAPVDLG